LASLILVVNVVGELQRKRTLAASRGFLAAARLSCSLFNYTFLLRQATSSGGLWFLCILSCILLLIQCKISLAAFIYIYESVLNLQKTFDFCERSVNFGLVSCWKEGEICYLSSMYHCLGIAARCAYVFYVMHMYDFVPFSATLYI